MGLLAMLGVLAIIGAAAVAAQAGGDPANISCEGGYEAIGFSQPSTDSLYATPNDAATAFLADLATLEGRNIPASVELVDLTTSTQASNDIAQIAAQADGKTVVVLSLSRSDGGWAVQSDISC